MSPQVARRHRWRAIERLRAFEAGAELRVDEVVAELCRNLPVPRALLEARRQRLQRERSRVEQRLRKLHAQEAMLRTELAALVQQDAELAGVEQRDESSPYVEELWADLREAFAQEAQGTASAIERWRQLEERLSQACYS